MLINLTNRPEDFRHFQDALAANFSVTKIGRTKSIAPLPYSFPKKTTTLQRMQSETERFKVIKHRGKSQIPGRMEIAVRFPFFHESSPEALLC